MFQFLSKQTIPLLLLPVLVTSDLSAKANRVAVRAEAASEYTVSRNLVESMKVQTYHLVEGKYFTGNVDDPELDAIGFDQIAEVIALNLKRQEYYPEQDSNGGDLLIMVHHGATNFFGDAEDNDVFDINDYLPPVETASGEIYEYKLSRDAMPKFYGTVLASDREAVKEQYFRAKLLGMDDIYSRSATDYEAFVQEELAREGRYFIILTAFDLPLLKKGEKKVLWTTRYNIRAIGQSYDEALKEMNLVASDYFGKNFDGLISRRSTDDSKVEIGEIEVIGEEESN